MSLESKYLKYKNKYLNLKNQLGGNIDEIIKFFHYLQSRSDLSTDRLEQIKTEIRRISGEPYDMSIDEFVRYINQFIGIDLSRLVELFQRESGVRPVPRPRPVPQPRQAAAAAAAAAPVPRPRPVPQPRQAAAAAPVPQQSQAAAAEQS